MSRRASSHQGNGEDKTKRFVLTLGLMASGLISLIAFLTGVPGLEALAVVVSAIATVVAASATLMRALRK